MIPKIIHYCWLSGDPFPPLVDQCINSWKQKLSDYEFVLWDTCRIDINSNLWLKQAIEKRKFAFASDYIRFYALYNYGGIYLDSDVEVVESFNVLLEQNYFIGEEVGGDIEAAVMGAEKGVEWIKECLDYYTSRPFIKENGEFDMTPVPLLVSQIAIKHNLAVFPYDFFSPKNYHIGKIDRSSKTFCIHHFEGKWVEQNIKYKTKLSIHRIIYFFLGRNGHNNLIKIIRQLK